MSKLTETRKKRKQTYEYKRILEILDDRTG